MKRGLVAATAVIMLSLCAVGAMAQHHGSVDVKTVDGREHPELIPENVAYFNFLYQRSVPANPTDDDNLHQGLQLGMLGLSGPDNLQLRLELSRFRAAFEAFNASYSKLASQGLVREDVFWGEVAKLVAQTRSNLNRSLSVQGHKRFEAGVQELRRNTIYYTGGAL